MNTRDHERFKILCALAVSGQLGEQEEQLLRAHIAQCADCRSRIVDMAQISAQALLFHPAKNSRCSLPQGLEERFVARAQAEGIPLKMEHRRFSTKLNWVGGFAAAAMLAIFAIANLSRIQLRRSTPPTEARLATHAVITPEQNLRATELCGNEKMYTPHSVRKAMPVLTPPHSSVDAPSRASNASLDVAMMRIPKLERVNLRLNLLTQDRSLFDSISHRFHYDPSMGKAMHQVSYLRSNVDWYRVWVDSQRNPAKSLDISVQ